MSKRTAMIERRIAEMVQRDFDVWVRKHGSSPSTRVWDGHKYITPRQMNGLAKSSLNMHHRQQARDDAIELAYRKRKGLP